MLIGNYSVLLKTPSRFLAGSTVSDNRAAKNLTGMSRNVFANSTMSATSAVPNGYTPGYCWIPAKKAGGMSSYGGILGSGGVSAGNLAGGLNAVAPLTGSGDITTANCALILSAVAALTGSGNITTASLNAIVDAMAALSGSGSVAASASALGLMGSPLTGSGTLTATSGALGSMSSSINVSGDLLTTVNVAAAVWGAIAAASNEAGSMGEKLNDAGAGGDPWSTDLPGAYAANTAGHRLGNMTTAVWAFLMSNGYSSKECIDLLTAIAAGKTDVSGNTATFRDLSDSRDAVVAVLSGNERTTITLDLE